MKLGVDTGTFKAYSNRSASTFKADLQGASIEDILKRDAGLIKVPSKDFIIRILLKKGNIPPNRI